ncbi:MULTISPECIES: hypothetical protein [Bradyrhizobium]|uniref:hypothetical protein n=1 Tax=Bradyrhizobium TaxID=374 RepID=UPI000D3B0CDB|nr:MULTISPECIES: hypothetical protein [Bradyrhizobium]
MIVVEAGCVQVFPGGFDFCEIVRCDVGGNLHRPRQGLPQNRFKLPQGVGRERNGYPERKRASRQPAEVDIAVGHALSEQLPDQGRRILLLR